MARIPREDSLAAQIAQLEAERKARAQRLKAQEAEASAQDEIRIGDLKARQLLQERATKRRQQADKASQQGGTAAPEPKDILPPPTGLNSKDIRLDPSQMPASAAIGGAGAQQALSQTVGGGTPGVQPTLSQQVGAQGPVPTVSSTQTTTGQDIVQVGPLRMPFSIPTQTTTTRQRQLTPREQGLPLLKDQIVQEGQALGLALFSGDEEMVAQARQRIQAQYGPFARAIEAVAVQEQQRLAFEQRKADLASKRIEERAKAREKRTAQTPSGRVKTRQAEILLKISRGEQPTKEERDFLDEQRALDPITRAVRDALGGAAPSPKAATQDDVDTAVQQFTEQTGRPPNSSAELRSFMESQGFTFE